MASRSAVRPLGAVSIKRLCKSSTLLVKELVNSARSLKLTRKNSSGIGGLEELDGSFARLGDFVGHAAAEIKDHADGNGHIFGREGDDFLLDAVLKHAEIVGFEAGDQAVVRVGDG